MPDSFDMNTPQKSADTVPAVPPSTSEVSVRTMASDIELMGKSGGTMNQGMGPAPVMEQVPVTPEVEAPVGPTGVAAPSVRPIQKDNSRFVSVLIWAIVIVFGGALLFALGFYLPSILGK